MKSGKESILKKAAAAFIVIMAIISAAGAWAYEPQSHNAGGVRVDVVPLQLRPGQQARFEIRMNTHSVELKFDIVAVSILKDDQGREYRATVWNGSPPEGHHRSGVLEFPALPDDAKSAALYLKDIANVAERVYEWTIE